MTPTAKQKQEALNKMFEKANMMMLDHTNLVEALNFFATTIIMIGLYFTMLRYGLELAAKAIIARVSHKIETLVRR